MGSVGGDALGGVHGDRVSMGDVLAHVVVQQTVNVSRARQSWDWFFIKSEVS